MMSLRLSVGGGGAIVIQMWLMIPAPRTSNSVRRSPLGMPAKRSPFPPVVSKLLIRRLRT